MATKTEKARLITLLDEIETLRCWLDDTAYPHNSRISLEKAIREVQDEFRLEGNDG